MYIICRDIVLIDETKARINYKLRVVREAGESKSFKLSKTKT